MSQLYLPLPTPIATPTGFVTPTWQLFFQSILPGGSSGFGTVNGPASSTDGAPALWDGTTGTLLKNSTPTGTGNPVLQTTPTFVTNITDPLVIGGTGAGSTLTLKSTSGVGTTDAIVCTVGNNGATEALRLTTAGNMIVGHSTSLGATTTPTTTLDVTGPALLNWTPGTGALGTGVVSGAFGLAPNLSFTNLLAQQGNSAAYPAIFAEISNDPASFWLTFYKTRSADGTTPAAVQNGDSVGVIAWNADTGTGNAGGRGAIEVIAYESGTTHAATMTLTTSYNNLLDQIVQIEYGVGTNVSHRAYATNSLRLPLGGPIFDHFTNVGNGTTVETDLYSDTIAGSTLSTNGDKLEACYAGTFVNHATATRELKTYFGGTMLFDSGAVTVAAGADSWEVRVSVIRVSSTTVRSSTTLITTGPTVTSAATYTEVTGLTLTGGNILKITGQAGGVGAASNDIVARLGSVTYAPAAL